MGKMRLIHCSDIHLDSALRTNLPWQEAQERKQELLATFLRMIAYAQEQGVRAVLIAGDLFDTKEVSETAYQTVLSAIRQHPEIDFLYLCGNHDEQQLFQAWEVPDNLKLFPGIGKAYRYGNVVITGLNRLDLQEKLKLREEDLNIVMLHGQIDSIAKYAGKYIDYMALGHIHSYESCPIDARGTYCYCGCLEARGFDECGKKGFVLLETDTTSGQKLHTEFVPFAKRTVWEIAIDCEGVAATPEVYAVIQQKVQQIPPQDMLRIVLTGEKPDGAVYDLEYLKKMLEQTYYLIRVKDETEAADTRQESGFEAHFIRVVSESGEEETMKREIIDCAKKVLHQKRQGSV